MSSSPFDTIDALVFVPGWALESKKLWEKSIVRLRQRQKELPCLLLETPFITEENLLNICENYQRDKPESFRIVLVGHSLGGMTATHFTTSPPKKSRFHVKGLLLINSFLQFCSSATVPQGSSPRLIQRMKRKITHSPQEVVHDFLKKIEAPFPPEADWSKPFLNLKTLSKGLDLLEKSTLSSPLTPLLSLRGGKDPLSAVPPSYFDSISEEIIPTGGHLLPLTHSQEVARWIHQSLRHLV